MLLCAVKRSRGGSDLNYDVIFLRREGSRAKRHTVTIRSLCGPGDDVEPIITLMLPDES